MKFLLLGFGLLLGSFGLKAQKVWEQLSNPKLISIVNALEHDNSLWLATSGGAYVSNDFGNTWVLKNEGFGKINEAQSNTIRELKSTSWGLVVLNDLGELYVRTGEIWVRKFEEYSFNEIEFFGGKLYGIGKNSELYPHWVFYADLLEMSNLESSPQVLKPHGSLFFNFADKLSVAGGGLIVANGADIEYYNGETFENITDPQNKFIPRSIVGTSKDNLHAIAFSFFSPNPYFQVVNYMRYNGYMWVEGKPTEEVSNIYALSQFDFKGTYYQYGVDQTSFQYKFQRLENVPLIGEKWVDISGLNSELESTPKGILEQNNSEYLFFGQKFVKQALTQFGVGMESQENGIFNGSLEKILLENNTLLALQDDKIKAYDLNSNEELVVGIQNNESMEDLFRFGNHPAAIQEMGYDSIAIHWLNENEWEAAGSRVQRSYSEVISRSPSEVVVRSNWDFDNKRLYYYKFVKETNSMAEFDYKLPADTFIVQKSLSANSGSELIWTIPVEATENSVRYYLGEPYLFVKSSSENNWSEIDLGLYSIYNKEGLYLRSTVLKGDTFVVALEYKSIEDDYSEMRLFCLDETSKSLKPYGDAIPLKLEKLNFENGVWTGVMNGRMFYSYDLKSFEITNNEGLPEGANIVAYDISGENVLASTDGNGLFKLVANTVGVSDLRRIDMGKLFPNPASEMVRFESLENTAGYTLLTMDGKVVRKENFDYVRKGFDITVANLPAGTYVLAIRSENGTISNEKLVVR